MSIGLRVLDPGFRVRALDVEFPFIKGTALCLTVHAGRGTSVVFANGTIKPKP